MKHSLPVLAGAILILTVSCSSKKPMQHQETVASTTADETRNTMNDSYENRKTADSQMRGSDSDVEVTRKIRDRLTDMDGLSMRAQNITIVTDSNDVTLKGTVDKQEEIQKILNVTRDIASNRTISNQLRVHK